MITDEKLAKWEHAANKSREDFVMGGPRAVAWAREAVPALIAEVRRLREVAAQERAIGAALERQAVVAWVRSFRLRTEWAAASEALASAIEREEHLK